MAASITYLAAMPARKPGGTVDSGQSGLISEHDLVRKPVRIPNQVRDGLFRDHALAQCLHSGGGGVQVRLSAKSSAMALAAI